MNENKVIFKFSYDHEYTDDISDANATYQTDFSMSQRKNVVFREIDLLGEKFDYALDVGCGTGLYARELSRRCNRVVAIDLSVGMLKHAKKINNQVSNIDFVIADAHNLPLKSECIDLSINVGVLQHFSKKTLKDVLGEMYRVVSGNGGYLFSETLNSSSVFSFFLRMVEAITSFLKSEKKGENGELAIDWYRFNPDWLQRLLKEIGFTQTHLYGVFILPGLLVDLSNTLNRFHRYCKIFLPINHSFLITAKKTEKTSLFIRD